MRCGREYVEHISDPFLKCHATVEKKRRSALTHNCKKKDYVTVYGEECTPVAELPTAIPVGLPLPQFNMVMSGVPNHIVSCGSSEAACEGTVTCREEEWP